MANSKVNKHISKKQTASSHTIIETAPKAALLMLCSGLFVLLISAVITLNAPSPLSFSKPLSLVSLCIGALAGGYLCGKRLEGTEAYVSAAVSALIITVLMLVSKLFIPAPAERIELIQSVFLHLMTPAVSFLGALIARNTKTKKRRKKSHYRS